MTIIIAATFPDYGGAMLTDSQGSDLKGGTKSLDLTKTRTIRGRDAHLCIGQSGDATFGDYALDDLQRHVDPSSNDFRRMIQDNLRTSADKYARAPSGVPRYQRENATKESRFLSLHTTVGGSSLYSGTTQTQRRISSMSAAIGSGAKSAFTGFNQEVARRYKDTQNEREISIPATLSCLLLGYYKAITTNLYCGGNPRLIIQQEETHRPTIEATTFALRIALARKEGIISLEEEQEILIAALLQDTDHLDLEKEVLKRASQEDRRTLINILHGY